MDGIIRCRHPTLAASASGIVAARHLVELFPGWRSSYVMGEQGVVQALGEHGFFSAEEDVIAVVAGMDRKLIYDRLRKATLFMGRGDRSSPPTLTAPSLPLKDWCRGQGRSWRRWKHANLCTPYIAGNPGSKCTRSRWNGWRHPPVGTGCGRLDWKRISLGRKL